jgi:hypothetical protein
VLTRGNVTVTGVVPVVVSTGCTVTSVPAGVGVPESAPEGVVDATSSAAMRRLVRTSPTVVLDNERVPRRRIVRALPIGPPCLVDDAAAPLPAALRRSPK